MFIKDPDNKNKIVDINSVRGKEIVAASKPKAKPKAKKTKTEE